MLQRRQTKTDRQMNREQRQKMEKHIRGLMTDRCSICREPFEHNDKTYGGVTWSGVTAFTSDCCQLKIVQFVTRGFFVDRRS